ncbi:MAG: uroporphyrinogen-III C-methyltransferase [Methylococcales bacterium]|nr:uroporphyrinogen-III C-methyltransferase [Methylococcales bacterium]
MAEELKQAVAENQPVQNQAVQEKQSKSYAGFVFGVINFILILLVMGAGFYLFQEMKDEQRQQSDEISKDDMRGIEASKQFNTFQTQLTTIQTQIATFSEEMAGKDNHFTKTLADFSQLHTEKLEATRKDLTDEIAQLKRQLGKTRGDWLIADAEYLLSVANQRLHLVGDVKTTRLALEAADQRLRESGDTAAFKVRKQLAKEIAGLRGVSLPDVVGVYAAIETLKDKVVKLAVLLPYAGKPLTESKQVHAHEQEQDADHGLLSSALQMLEGYVTVKHSDQPITKILTEEEVVFIREQLNIKLEMVKIALVQQNDTLYKSGISDARRWLNNNFTKNTSAKGFLTELDKLKAIEIRSQFPDISQSLKMLKDITKLRIEVDKAKSKPVDKVSTDKAIVAPAS